MPEHVVEGQQDASTHSVSHVSSADGSSLDKPLVTQSVPACLPTDGSEVGVSHTDAPSSGNEMIESEPEVTPTKPIVPIDQISQDLAVIDELIENFPDRVSSVDDDMRELQQIALGMHRHYADIAKNNADVDLPTDADDMASKYLDTAIDVVKARQGLVEKIAVTLLKPRVSPGKAGVQGGNFINAPNATSVNINATQKAENRRNKIEELRSRKETKAITQHTTGGVQE